MDTFAEIGALKFTPSAHKVNRRDRKLATFFSWSVLASQARHEMKGGLHEIDC